MIKVMIKVMVTTYRQRFCAREEVISSAVGNLVLQPQPLSAPDMWLVAAIASGLTRQTKASTIVCRVFHTVSKTPCVVFRSVMMSR